MRTSFVIFFAITLSFYLYADVKDSLYNAKSYCVLDQNNNIVKAKNELEHLPPASTLKLVTAMVVIDNLPLDNKIIASKNAQGIESVHISIKAGETFVCEDLLKALLIQSANDAAIVLAESTAGTIQKFCEMMNEKAKKLGCKDSNFLNPHGLPIKKQYSCAYDLALIAKAASEYPKIIEYLSYEKAKIVSTQGRSIDLKNGNKLLKMSSVLVLGKTGYTYSSQNTFAGFCSKEQGKFSVGIMGSPERSILWTQIMSLLELKEKIEISNAEIMPRTIKNAQILLQILGYYKGQADGIIGPQTKMAVQKFQQEKGLEVDGIVGTKTWQALIEAVKNSSKETKKNSLEKEATNPKSETKEPINKNFQ